MRSDAYITVTCDGCGDEIQIQLTATARGYDERGVDGELEIAGWTTVDGKDYLLQLTGDEYTTGWHAPLANNGDGAWMGLALNQSPPQYRIEDGAVEKWCNIVRPYDAPDAEK